jgi:hypothetical protein
MPRLWELFSPKQWNAEEKVGLEHYVTIGSDGAGNPLCADERDGKVVLLDHELLFDVKRRDKRTMLVNSGIPELAQSLLAYQRSSPDSFWRSLCEIDPPAAEKGTFWSYEHSATNGEEHSLVWKLLCLRLGPSHTPGARWLWVLISAALGLVLAIVISRLFRR